MKKPFLLTGKPRVGKSTLIKNLINEIGFDLCGGFYTEEIRNSNDRIGFRCVSMDGETVEISHVDSPSQIRIGRYGVNVEKFEEFAIRKLNEAMKFKKIIILDEIGFMQMISKPFQKVVKEMVLNRNIVLGTIPADSHPDIDPIKFSKEVELISVNEWNRDKVSTFLIKEIKETVNQSFLG